MTNRTKKLRKARADAGVTTKELADKVGVSTQTIFNYEIGKCNPADDKFALLKKVLKLTGKYEDWYERKIVRKYGPEDVCAREGCNKKPVSNGYCMTHYISEWRKTKRKKDKVDATENAKTALKKHNKATKGVAKNNLTVKKDKDALKMSKSKKSTKTKTKKATKKKTRKTAKSKK